MSDDVVIQKTADAQTQPHLTQRLADALSPAKLTETGKNAALKLTYASRAAKERLANSYVFNLRSLLGSHPALDRDRSEELFLQNRTVHYNAKLTEHENGDRVLGISMFIFSVERGNIDGVSAVYRGMLHYSKKGDSESVSVIQRGKDGKIFTVPVAQPDKLPQVMRHGSIYGAKEGDLQLDDGAIFWVSNNMKEGTPLVNQEDFLRSL